MVPVLYIENMYDIWSSIYFMMLKNSFTIVFALYIISWFFCKSVLIKYALLFSQWYSSFCSWENNIACQIQVDDQSKKFWMQLFKEFFSTLIIYKLLINYLILNLQHLCYVTEFFFFVASKICIDYNYIRKNLSAKRFNEFSKLAFHDGPESQKI